MSSFRACLVFSCAAAFVACANATFIPRDVKDSRELQRVALEVAASDIVFVGNVKSYDKSWGGCPGAICYSCVNLSLRPTQFISDPTGESIIRMSDVLWPGKRWVEKKPEENRLRLNRQYLLPHRSFIVIGDTQNPLCEYCQLVDLLDATPSNLDLVRRSIPRQYGAPMSVPTVSQTKRSWESWYPWWQPDEEIGATLTVTAYGDIACAELGDQESLLPVEESSKMRQELGSWLQSQVVLTPSMLDKKPIPVRISATIRIEKKRVTLKIGA